MGWTSMLVVAKIGVVEMEVDVGWTSVLVIVMEVGMGWTSMLVVVEMEVDVGWTSVLVVAKIGVDAGCTSVVVTACRQQKKHQSSDSPSSLIAISIVTQHYDRLTKRYLCNSNLQNCISDTTIMLGNTYVLNA